MQQKAKKKDHEEDDEEDEVGKKVSKKAKISVKVKLLAMAKKELCSILLSAGISLSLIANSSILIWTLLFLLNLAS